MSCPPPFTRRQCPLPPLWPPTQDPSWEWPALNIVVCWEQHGVMWTRPREAHSGGLRREPLSDVSLSAKRFSAFNLWVLQYTVHFLFVATDERGPGGIRQITGAEDWDKVRRQVPWAGPPPPHLRRGQCSLNWLFRIVESHIRFYVRCKCSVDFP